jgi:hypothetical protein
MLIQVEDVMKRSVYFLSNILILSIATLLSVGGCVGAAISSKKKQEAIKTVEQET